MGFFLRILFIWLMVLVYTVLEWGCMLYVLLTVNIHLGFTCVVWGWVLGWGLLLAFGLCSSYEPLQRLLGFLVLLFDLVYCVVVCV